jgi:hypothetical protein
MKNKFEYKAEVVYGNFFQVAKIMNTELAFEGWELVAVESVNVYHSVILVKRRIS